MPEGWEVRILLLHPQLNVARLVPETPSMALLILGTLAQQRGHEVKIEHLDLVEDISSELADYKPDLVGVTCNTFQVKSAKMAINAALSKGIRVILGGPHAMSWNGIAPVDSVVIGEGENKWLELIGEKPCIESINDIPVPNYDLVDMDKFCGVGPIGAFPSIAIMASRGCPYQCTFCNTPLFWGKKVRYRNPNNVLFEIGLLHHKYGINEIFFQDDTFNLNHEWASEIFKGIIRNKLNKEMVFKIDCRVDERLITKEFLELAATAGVWNIFYGIESGSQEMLDRMKKGITVAEIKRAVKMTHEAGIKTQCSFIIGLPGESMRTLRETDALLHEIEPIRHGWAFFCPFPGTEATAEVIRKGHIKQMDYSEYGYGQVMARTDALNFEELEAFGGFSYQ
jgi:radical SAM superfamily enzyme YgiQ (UPF0313 family)